MHGGRRGIRTPDPLGVNEMRYRYAIRPLTTTPNGREGGALPFLGRRFREVLAGMTRLELAASALTGQRSNQLSYTPTETLRFPARNELELYLKINRESRAEETISLVNFPFETVVHTIAPHAKVAIYPNALPAKPLPRAGDEEAIVFSGNMEYHPNFTAVRFFRREHLAAAARTLAAAGVAAGGEQSGGGPAIYRGRWANRGGRIRTRRGK